MSEVRIAVGNPDGRHGLSWRVGSSNNSFYISCRIMKGTQKVSVHPPSEKGPDVAFFHGTEAPHRESMEDPTMPRIERYYPKELGPGVRRVATIRVYAASLQVTAPVKKTDSVIWIDPPEKHLGVDIHILLTERTELARQWCAARGTPSVSFVDESTLGDLLLYFQYTTRPPKVVLSASYGDESDESVVGKVGTVAHSIESIDDSLVMEELPTFDNWPPMKTGAV